MKSKRKKESSLDDKLAKDTAKKLRAALLDLAKNGTDSDIFGISRAVAFACKMEEFGKAMFGENNE